MKEFSYVVSDKLGLHARPAGQLAKVASCSESQIFIKFHEKRISLKRLTAVITLQAKQGDEVWFEVEGGDEEHTIQVLKKTCQEYL